MPKEHAGFNGWVLASSRSDGQSGYVGNPQQCCVKVRQPALPSSGWWQHTLQQPQQWSSSQRQLARVAAQTEHPGSPAARTCGLPAAPALLALGCWPSKSVNTFSSRACRTAARDAETGATARQY